MDITRKMIEDWIDYYKSDECRVISYDEAKDQLEKLKAKGCLLYDDCRSCPKFGKNCPL